jgi:hypothetical protein
MRIARLLLLGLISVGYAAAQITGCMMVPHTLPDDLRSSLEQRLSTFLSTQAEGDWGQVAELMGDRYTSSYKQSLVSRMQELRMSSFDFSIHDLSTCSSTLGNEPGPVNRLTAEHLSWYLAGTGQFQTSSETWTEQTAINGAPVESALAWARNTVAQKTRAPTAKRVRINRPPGSMQLAYPAQLA